MYIREIHIEKFRHLQDVHLGPFREPTSLSEAVALAGPNGGGKSSVLELLALGLSSTFSLQFAADRQLEDYAFEVAIALTRDEVSLVRQVREKVADEKPNVKEALTHLEDRGYYYRVFNRHTQFSQREDAAQNQLIHDLVYGTLRQHYSRPPGFWIRSERLYPAAVFDQRKLLSDSTAGGGRKRPQEGFNSPVPFGLPEAQYMDMFDFLIQQRHYYIQQLGFSQEQLLTPGSNVNPYPPNPLEPYDELLNRLFPNYRFARTQEKMPTNLFVHRTYAVE